MTDLHLYQILHLHRGEVRMLTRHIARLDYFAHRIFNRSYTPDLFALRNRIVTLAIANNYPTGVSGFIRIALNSEGKEFLTAIGTSLYDGYAFRSLMPDAASVCYELPFGEAPTSAHEIAADLANRQAQRHGAQIAIRCDRSGIFRSVGCAPIFAVRGYTVLTPPLESFVAQPTTQNIEQELVRRAAEIAGLEFREEPFGKIELPQLDELFFADHRGITAFAHCDSHPLMSLMAERIATGLERLFPKK
ncbi:MAG: branched-chain amino acid aminotransferase [Rikenellaceae bacterium]|nr:branched-chain amino acid aminotransferase [Rikenellaceae bacterium]